MIPIIFGFVGHAIEVTLMPSHSNMSHPITIPIFGSNSGQQGSIHQEPTSEVEIADAVDWNQELNHGGVVSRGGGGGSGVGETDMDFDLLAEYLLEENSSHGGSGMNFDLK
jgi:hypothetical protein